MERRHNRIAAYPKAFISFHRSQPTHVLRFRRSHDALKRKKKSMDKREEKRVNHTV